MHHTATLCTKKNEILLKRENTFSKQLTNITQENPFYLTCHAEQNVILDYYYSLCRKDR